jgi:N-carbamoylputrescine amidase
MASSTIKLGLIQHACGPDKQANVDKACALIADAAGQGAELIITPELFASEYFPQTEDEQAFALAEPIPGPTSQRLCDLAGEHKVRISGSLFERRAPGLYHNSSIMIDPAGQITGIYRKMHIPDDPRFYEKYYFTPGDGPDSGSGGWSVQAAGQATVGMLICWDQWYPEAARLTALRGAQVLVYPTAIGWYHGETDTDRAQQRDAWRTIQRSHAIANGVFVAAVNRVGTEDELTFWGGSFVADPGGVILAEAADDQEQVLVVECELGRISQIRHGWPFLRDRRVDAYADLTRRWID